MNYKKLILPVIFLLIGYFVQSKVSGLFLVEGIILLNLYLYDHFKRVGNLTFR